MYGLRPWDADPDNPGCLTYGEVVEYQRALGEHVRQVEALNDQRR